MKKWITPVVVLLVLAGAGWGGYRWWRARAAQQQPVYRTVQASRADVVAQVTASGTLSALVTVLVGSQVSGRLSEVLVDFNSPVKKGQILARLDPQLFQAAVTRERANAAQARASLTRAKAQAESARRQAERMKMLADEKLATPQELEVAMTAAETARADVLVAQAGVEQAAASVKQAEINLAYTTITCPVDGVVISRAVDVGQTVAASLSAPTLFTIAGDLRQMQVDSNVAEADVGKLKPGVETAFTVDAYPGETFRGVVREVRNAPQTIQNVVTYDAVIDVANPDLKLKPGMTANVKFVVDKRERALRIPNAALRFRPPADITPATPSASGSGGRAWPAGSGSGGRRERGPGAGGGRDRDKPSDRKTIYVLRAGVLTRVSIRAGVSDGSFTEVIDGPLAEGDEVVVEVELPDGAPKPVTTTTGTPPGGGGTRGPRMGL